MTGAIGPLAPDNARGGLHGIAWSREIQVDKDAAEPLYQQLYTQIRDLIRSGRFGDGTRLPASRRLAQGLGVSRNTVVLAYQRLQEDGYVRGMAGGGTVANATSGRGTRSADRSDGPPAATARGDAISAGPGPLNSAFPVGVPPVDLFPAGLWATLTSRRLRVSGERLLLGTGNAGHRSLRKAVAAYLGVVRGIQCAPEQVIVTHGMNAGLDLISRAVLTSGDQVWCEEPGYPGVRRVLARNGLVCRPVPVDADGLAVESALAGAPDAALAMVSAARQLPMCAALSRPRRHRLLEHTRTTGMWLVEHENDAAFLHPDAPPPLFTEDPDGQVIYVGTLNTVLFPQLHVGFCVVPTNLVEPVGQVLGEIGGSVSSVTQKVLADFLDHHRFARFLDRARQACVRRRQSVADALDRLPGAALEQLGRPAEGSSLTAVFPGPVDDVALAADARRVSLQLTPLARFHAGTPAVTGFVLGCAGVRDEAIDPAMRLLAPLVARHARRIDGAR